MDDPRRAQALPGGVLGTPEPEHVDAMWEAARVPPIPRAAGIDPRPLTFPPYLYPPPEALNLYRSGFADVAGPASWAVPAGLIFQLAAQDVARIAVFGVSVLNLLATSRITFRLRANERPVEGFGDVAIIPGPAAFYKESFDVFVRVPRGAKIDVMVTVTDAAAYTVGAWFEGWHYAQSIERAFLTGSRG